MPDSLVTTVHRTCPVVVLAEYQVIHDNRWIDGRWIVTGVVAGQQMAGNALHSRLVHSSEAGQQYLWTDTLRVELHADETESYHCNLMSVNPGVFVICEEQQAGQDSPASKENLAVDRMRAGDVASPAAKD
jgi:hypothetical protein